MKKRAIVIILILIVLLTYPVFKIRSAHDRVKQLYHQVSVGMPIGQVEEEAKKLRLKVIKSEANGSNPGNVIAWDG
jgi:hypothetical protein